VAVLRLAHRGQLEVPLGQLVGERTELRGGLLLVVGDERRLGGDPDEPRHGLEQVDLRVAVVVEQSRSS
jgi:hypothetical protein